MTAPLVTVFTSDSGGLRTPFLEISFALKQVLVTVAMDKNSSKVEGSRSRGNQSSSSDSVFKFHSQVGCRC